MSETPGEPFAGEGEPERGLLPRWLGLPKAFSENRKLALAGRHLSVLGALLCLALATMAWTIYNAEASSGIESPMQTLLRWTAVFSVALAGSVLNRMVAVSFTGFKYKRYDALGFPHDLVIALRAPFVAVALVALGVFGLSDIGLDKPIPTLAVAFGLGYFSDMAFERFRDAIRTLLGKKVDSDEPERPLIQGIDVPLRSLELDADVLRERLGLSPADVEALRKEGIEYGHELIELWRTPEGKSRLTDRTGLPEATLQRVVEIVDVARTGAPLPVAGRLVAAGIRSGQAVATCDEQDIADALSDGEETVQRAISEGQARTGVSPTELQRNARELLENV